MTDIIENINIDNNNDDDDFSFNLKKKKKKKKIIVVNEEEKKIDNTNTNGYPYLELLIRLYKQMPIQTERNRQKLPIPLVSLMSKKTCWHNFGQFCKTVKRTPEQVSLYFYAELLTTGSLNSQCELLLKGRFHAKSFESLIKQYIKTYVECGICTSVDTFSKRDPITRLTFVSCNNCSAERTVATIKVGFKATTRADRKEMKK